MSKGGLLNHDAGGTGVGLCCFMLKFFIILSVFPCGTCKAKCWGLISFTDREKCFGLRGYLRFCRFIWLKCLAQKGRGFNAASSSCKLGALYKLLFVSPSTPSGTLTMLRLASSSLSSLCL